MANTVRLVRKKDRLRQKIERIVPGVEKQMAGDLEKGASEIAAMAQRLAPVAEVQPERRPGEYKDSIRAGPLDETKHQITTRVRGVRGVATKTLAFGVFANWYWLFIEHGTSRGVKARPHLMPSYRALKKRVYSRVSRGIGKAIKKASR